MKSILTGLIIAIILFNADVFAQCRQQDVYNCAKNNGNAIYLRDFNVKLKKQKPHETKPQEARFSVVLNKGTKYRFNLCNCESEEGGKPVLKLYDGKKEVGSTHYVDAQKVEKDFPMFDFVCTKSAIYYISIYMNDGEKGSVVGVLSFVGKQD